MRGKIIITAETGSDITKELAKEHGIVLIPMHVSMGDKTLDDGTFPPEEVCAYYDRTGKAPTTSGSTPYEFERFTIGCLQRIPTCRSCIWPIPL